MLEGRGKDIMAWPLAEEIFCGFPSTKNGLTLLKTINLFITVNSVRR